MRERFWLKRLMAEDHLRPKHKWEDNIKMYLREIGFGSVIHMAQDSNRWRALVGKMLNHQLQKRREMC
jgi:hypothetical protein